MGATLPFVHISEAWSLADAAKEVIHDRAAGITFFSVHFGVFQQVTVCYYCSIR